jgi:hypothetical protein
VKNWIRFVLILRSSMVFISAIAPAIEMIRGRNEGNQNVSHVTFLSLSPSGDRGVEKTADEPGPTQPLVLSDLNMRWDLPDHIEECGAAALAAHLRGSHASGCMKNHPEHQHNRRF